MGFYLINRVHDLPSALLADLQTCKQETPRFDFLDLLEAYGYSKVSNLQAGKDRFDLAQLGITQEQVDKFQTCKQEKPRFDIAKVSRGEEIMNCFKPASRKSLVSTCRQAYRAMYPDD